MGRPTGRLPRRLRSGLVGGHANAKPQAAKYFRLCLICEL
jgi:hypothetical protein